MKIKWPLRGLIFLGVFLGLYQGIRIFFDRGGKLDLSVFEPFYKGFLEKSGIQRADIFLEWEKSGHRPWVLSAQNVTFHGGCLKSAKFQLGWHDGKIQCQNIAIDHITIDSTLWNSQPAPLHSKRETSTSPIPALLSVLMEIPGSIHTIRLVGEHALGQTEKRVRGLDSAPRNLSTIPSNAYGDRPDLLPPMDILWKNGKIDFYEAQSPNPDPSTVQDRTGLGPMPEKDSSRDATQRSDTKNIATHRLLGAKHRWAWVDLKMTPEGGQWTASWIPIPLNAHHWGVQAIRLQGQAKGQWTMTKDTPFKWTIEVVADQCGSGRIMEPHVAIPMEVPTAMSTAKPSNTPPQSTEAIPATRTAQSDKACACIIEKMHFSAQLSDDWYPSVHFHARLDQAKISGTLTTQRHNLSHAHHWMATAKLENGTILIQKLRHLWPNIQQTKDAREWILSHLHAGKLQSVSTRIEGLWDTIAQKSTLKSIQGSFKTSDMAISFMPSLSPIEHMEVTSTFDENGFVIRVHKGLFEQHSVNGTVTINWKKSPTVLTFDAHLGGLFSHLVPILLSFAGDTGLSFSQLTGSDQTHIKGQLPLISNLAPKDVTIDLHCQIPDAGFDMPIENRMAHIRKTPITLDYKDQQLRIQGKGPINGILTTWSWNKDTLTFSGQPNVEQIQDILHWSPAPYLHNAPIITGQYQHPTLTLHIDLTPCIGSIPAFLWHKEPGSKLILKWIKKKDYSELSATGSGIVGRLLANHSTRHPTITAEMHIGKTFGKYVYTGDQKVSSETELWHIAPQSGHHQIFFRSPLITIPKLFSEKETTVFSPAKPPADYVQPKPVKIDIDWACEKVQLNTITMNQVALCLSGTATSIWPISMDFLNQYSWHQGSFYSENKSKKNKVEKIGHISASWDPSGKKTTRIIADIVDIGSVCHALGLTERILGGNVRLNATQEASGTYTGSIYGDQIQTKTNMLEKLLWTISPTIFTEMFSSGITFSRLDADFRYEPGLLKIMDGIGTGVNLGLSIKGSIYTQPGRFKLQGVAIPSYLINTFFSKFPFLGWIFGGKKGLISSEFKVTGPLNDPKFTVLPLSVFKFGFLKNLPFFKKKKKNKNNPPNLSQPPNHPVQWTPSADQPR